MEREGGGTQATAVHMIPGAYVYMHRIGSHGFININIGLGFCLRLQQLYSFFFFKLLETDTH